MSLPTDTQNTNWSDAGRAVRRSQRAGQLFKVVVAGLVAGGCYLVGLALLPQFWQGPVDVSLGAPEMPGQAVSYDSDVKGLDKEHKPYRIKASRGYQDAKNKDIVHLETFNGTFKRPSGSDLQVTSTTGVYDSQSKTLDLSGNVEISDGPRFAAKMDKARFDVDKRSLTSQSPVTVKTENGNIAADSLVADNNGERMLFRGNVKASFNRPAPTQGGNP
jgi:lipopolysaccharide export system protein LptC